eukprot:gene6394-12932_t
MSIHLDASKRFFDSINIPPEQDIIQKHILNCVTAYLCHQLYSRNPTHDSKSAIFWTTLSEISLHAVQLISSSDKSKSFGDWEFLLEWLSDDPQKGENSVTEHGVSLQCAVNCQGLDEKYLKKIGLDVVRSPKNNTNYCATPVTKMSPMHLAASSNNSNPSILRNLITIFPRMSRAESIDGRLPLHKAVKYANKVAVVNDLLESYPQGVIKRTSSGRTPLHDACYNPTSEMPRILDMILKAAPDSVEIRDHDGNLPLHILIKTGRCNTCIDILADIINLYPEGISVKNLNNETPLIIALKEYIDTEICLIIIKLLLNANSNSASITDGEGYLPLQHSIMCSKDIHILQQLIISYPDSLKYLDSQGQSVLHLLIENFPHAIKIQNFEGNTPLHLLIETDVWMKHVRTSHLEYLLQMYPESTCVLNHRGCTPLHMAMNIDIVELQLEAVTSMIKAYPLCVSIPDFTGQLPLTIAELTADNDTPLHCFIRRQNISQVTPNIIQSLRFLIQIYPEALHMRNNTNDTPYDMIDNTLVHTEIIRIILISAPLLHARELYQLNYNERRMALFLFFTAISEDLQCTIFSMLRRSRGGECLMRRVVEYI